MRLIFLFALMVGLALAQDAPAPAEVRVTPLGIPCEPGQPTPFGEGFPIQCPPVEEQGIMVFLKATDDNTVAFKAKVRYTTADGQAKEAEQVITRSKATDWTVAIYQIGRVKTDSLSGITVDGVDVEQLTSDPSAVTNARKRKTHN